MRNVMRVLAGLVGLFNILLGLGFLVDPAASGARFFLTALGSQGLATMRADFTAFFVVGGVFALAGALKAHRAPLLVPIALLGTAFFGRCVNLIADGAAPTAYSPMIAETVMIVILALAARTFERDR